MFSLFYLQCSSLKYKSTPELLLRLERRVAPVPGSAGTKRNQNTVKAGWSGVTKSLVIYTLSYRFSSILKNKSMGEETEKDQRSVCGFLHGVQHL